ncbi:endolysin [Pseudomonas phage vB_PaeP_FBPa6]|nr:endolysin [Pseudomonas phage vB_PaeP_FBPa6]
MWNKVTINGQKVVSKGLVNRRNAEIKQCLEPSSQYSSLLW